MSGQAALTENPPMILDATCSRRRIWPAFATVRIDIRPEMKPDIVAVIPKPDGTIGEHTAIDIAHANKHGKRVLKIAELLSPKKTLEETGA